VLLVIFFQNGGDSSYFSGWQSGAYRLYNGNTFITVAQQKYIFEVNSNNEIVWECHIGGNLGWLHFPLRAYKLEPSFFLNNYNSSKNISVIKINQNYPNPFNTITTINYELPKATNVEISIYNLMGRIVKNLINTNQNSGYKYVIWDGTNNNGKMVSGGMYFYSIKTNIFSKTRKMILLK